jgi:hypothetical protein
VLCGKKNCKDEKPPKSPERGLESLILLRIFFLAKNTVFVYFVCIYFVVFVVKLYGKKTYLNR